MYIYIKEEDFNFFRFHMSPFFEISITEYKEGNWRIFPYYDNNMNLSSMFMFEHIFDNISESEKREYMCDFTRNAIAILEPSSISERLQITIRLCRDIIKNLNKRNMLFLHGGMVAYRNKGICILGEKKSGKTSTILSFLSNDADFIVNDDLSISVHSSGKLIGYGWPRAISIRKDTLDKVFSKEKGNAIERFIGLHPDNVKEAYEGHTFIYVDELEKLFECCIRRYFSIDAIIFPEFHNEVGTIIEKVKDEEKLQMFYRFVDKNVNKYFRKFETYFEGCFADKESMEHILGYIPMYHVKQNIGNISETIELVGELLKNV